MIRDAMVEPVTTYYNGEVPEYIVSVGKTFITLRVGDWQGLRNLHITIADVIDYYWKDARNITSGIRTLAGHAGDWRMIDNLAKEALEWFKFINRPALVREGKKHGMTLRG